MNPDRCRIANAAFDLRAPGDKEALASCFLQRRLQRSWCIELPPGHDRYAVLDA